MKMIRTRLGYEQVLLPRPGQEHNGEDVETILITREGREVSDDDAEFYRVAAAKVGVQLKVDDVADPAPATGAVAEDLPDGSQPAKGPTNDGGTPAQVTSPDLSAGVAAVTGQGAPVETPPEKPGGTTQAGNKAGDTTGRVK